MSTESVASVIGDAALALSLLVVLAFGMAQARSGAQDRRERLTLTTIQEFQTREMAAHFQRLSSSDLPDNWRGVQALSAEDQVSFIHYAQQMEMLGLMVYEGMIELALVERTLGDYVAFSWEKYKPFTYDRRGEDPYLNEYFEWLAKRLDEYMRANPRQPAFTTIAARSQSH